MSASPATPTGVLPLSESADPYGAYARLRRAGPFLRDEQLGIWLATAHATAVEVLSDPRTFSSSVMAPADPVLLGADPPAHTRARQVLDAALGGGRVETLARSLRARADQLVAQMAATGHGDAVAGLAAPLPLGAMADLLGAPADRHGDLERWSKAVVAAGTGAATGPGDDPAEAIHELTAWLRELIERRARRPGEDVLSVLAAGLTTDEALSVARLLVVAGRETTVHLIGNAVLALATHPRELDEVTAAPELITSATAEAARWDPPVPLVLRRAARRATIAGVTVSEGDIVAVLLASANRDEHACTDPARFAPRRGGGHGLAFGLGPHRCPGVRLAQLEARAALAALLARGARLHPDQRRDGVERTPSLHLRGPLRLRLVFPGYGEV